MQTVSLAKMLICNGAVVNANGIRTKDTRSGVPKWIRVVFNNGRTTEQRFTAAKTAHEDLHLVSGTYPPKCSRLPDVQSEKQIEAPEEAEKKTGKRINVHV